MIGISISIIAASAVVPTFPVYLTLSGVQLTLGAVDLSFGSTTS
jgi:hypothetical protein